MTLGLCLRFTWLCTIFFILFWMARTTEAPDPHLQTTRDELLANRKRRNEQLERMLHDVKVRLADHQAGTKPLSNDDVLDLQRKADIYQRKLDTMSQELDEREIERILRREELRNERLSERRARRSEL